MLTDLRNYFLKDRLERQSTAEVKVSKLIWMSCFLTALFDIIYIITSIYIDFSAGAISQAIAFTLFVVLLFAFKYTKWSNNTLGILYSLNCFQTISVLPFFSGGISDHSLIIPWLSIVPAMSLLLTSKKNAWFFLVLCAITIIIYAFIPDEYTKITYNQQLDKPFSVVVYIGLCLIILILNLVFKKSESEAFLNLEKANQNVLRQNDEIKYQKDKLEKNSAVINQAYSKLEESNSKILASVQYAKRIQHAILPTENYIKSILPDSFVYFRPRDVVSGDFYWIEEFNNKIYFAAIDCTGHGVPGAFMSLIGNSLLNEIVYSGIDNPGEILTLLNKKVTKTLNQSKGGNKDGMDMSICVYNADTNTLEFAGAKNPLIIIDSNGLTKIKGDSCSIGGTIIEKHKNFEFKTHQFVLEEDTMLYQFTDGYQDQFGGELNRKFSQKRMRNTFEQIHSLNLYEQLPLIDTEFKDWKQDTHQIDDVLVIGVKLRV